MSFSQEWDDRFRANQNISIWPWSDVVSYVNRHARPGDGFRRVLELGCGAGANIPFFLKMNMEYAAIEGSATIVARLHERFPELKGRVVAGDFTQEIPFEGPFDIVLDRSAMTHNSTVAIRRTLNAVFRRLRRGGKLIGVDWFSTSHQDSGRGDALDGFTRTNIPSGQFAGVGAVHFSDQEHLVALLRGAGFAIERLEHKQSATVIPEAGGQFAAWNFVAARAD